MRTYERLASVAMLGAIVGAVLTSSAAAQQPATTAWQPWQGCWRAVNAPVTKSGEGAAEVCVVPAAAGDGADVFVIDNGKVTHRELISSSAQRVAKQSDGCDGWEQGTWSGNGRRLFVRSQMSCGSTKLTGSGMFAMTPAGEWLELRGSVIAGQTRVRAVRYRPTGRTLAAGSTTGAEGAPVVFVLEPASAKYGRMEAAAPVSTDGVLEAARALDTAVVEAWLNELQQKFTLSGRELTRLADAGLPPRVIDLMVALTYPTAFTVQTASGGGLGAGGGAALPRGMSADAERRWASLECGFGSLSMMYGYYDPFCSPYYARYGAYGYGNWYGAYGGYGYNPYGYYGGYYYGSRPIVILPGTPETNQTNARAVNGAGYTRGGGGSTGTTARPGAISSPSGGGTSGSSSGASGSSGGSSSGSSSSGGRTAQPRNPPQ